MRFFRCILTLCCCFFIVSTVRGQQIFNFVLYQSYATIHSSSAPFVQQQLAQFTIDALLYIHKESELQKLHTTDAYYDAQAYGLSQFLFLYKKRVLNKYRANLKKQAKLVSRFMKASGSHPLFNAPILSDGESYIENTKTLTPFHLNTDWVAAFEEISK